MRNQEKEKGQTGFLFCLLLQNEKVQDNSGAAIPQNASHNEKNILASSFPLWEGGFNSYRGRWMGNRKYKLGSLKKKRSPEVVSLLLAEVVNRKKGSRRDISMLGSQFFTLW